MKYSGLKGSPRKVAERLEQFRQELCLRLALGRRASNREIFARLDAIDSAFSETIQERDQCRLNDPLMLEAQEISNGHNGARHKSYGRAEDVFRSYGLIWTGLLAHKLKPGRIIDETDVALLMAALKLARDSQNGKRDNIVDAHGYLSILARLRGWFNKPESVNGQLVDEEHPNCRCVAVAIDPTDEE